MERPLMAQSGRSTKSPQRGEAIFNDLNRAGQLLEWARHGLPSDFQSEVSRRVNFFKVGAGRHQVNRIMIPREKPVWLLFAGCEAKNSDVERFCAVHIFDGNADVVQAFDKQIGAPSATSTKTKFANRAWFGKMEASFANNLLFRLDLRKHVLR
jgi:hypothetical protein